MVLRHTLTARCDVFRSLTIAHVRPTAYNALGHEREAACYALQYDDVRHAYFTDMQHTSPFFCSWDLLARHYHRVGKAAGRQWGCNQLTSNMLDCASVSHGVVAIPAVHKGLNNQRMRIVQDIVSAMLVGAAVELPSHLMSRQNCHYNI